MAPSHTKEVSMFERFARSWELVKASAGVLAADKELLVFPLISGVLSILVLATFAVPALLAGLGDQAMGGDESARILGSIVAFAFYVVQYFVIIFCNTALVGAALIRLRGGDPTVGDGFKVAMSRVGSIFGYAVVSATVGMILRTLSQRGGVFGRIAASLLGLGWGLATYLVVPILVVEDVGPVEAVKRSTAYLKRTWGEQVVGNAGMGAVFGLMFVGVTLVGVAGLIGALAMESGVLAGVVGATMVLTFLVLALVSSALSGIYAAAVYRYAAEGQTGGFFPEAMIKGTFASKA
jgi:hypothetical protein